MAFAEDLSLFFDADGFAVTASWGASTAQVLMRQPTEDILGGRAQSNEYELTMPAAEFAGINRGDTLTIAGVSYRLREKPRLVGDGALKTLLLERV